MEVIGLYNNLTFGLQINNGDHVRMKFSISSERITYPAPPITRDRVNLPPGTSCGRFEDIEELEYLSDQDIAAGRTPNSTRTTNTGYQHI